MKLKLDINNVDDRNELHNTNSAYYKQISKHLEEEVNSKFMSINSQVGYYFICAHTGMYNSLTIFLAYKHHQARGRGCHE